MSSDPTGDLRERTAVLEHRVDQLEVRGHEATSRAEPAKEPKRRDRWDVIQLLIPLITPVVVGLVGLGLKDSFDRSLRRDEFQLANVREMRQLLVELQAEGATPESAQATALTIAAFGRPAVGPLVTTVATGDGITRPAAEQALRAIGLTEAQAVCGAVVKIADNRSGRFTWLTHLSALRLLGDLECQEARPTLARYRQLLDAVTGPDKLTELAPVFEPSVPSDMDSVQQLRSELERGQARIGK